MSYGWLGDDYDIRVGRSREITGPYLDYQGNSLDGGGWGLKLAGSYRFRADRPWAASDTPGWQFAGFRGPGHGVPFLDPVSKQYFFVHHVRDGAEVFRRREHGRDSFRMHYMAVRRMFFLDGWPVLSPQPYAGEKGEPWLLQAEPESEKSGADLKWEWLRLRGQDNRQARGTVGPLPEDLPPGRALAFACYDYENSRECLGLAGITTGGDVIWGKDISTTDTV